MNQQKRCKCSATFIGLNINSVRGQVTIFLIVGIVILFIFAGAYYLFAKITKAPLTTKVEQQTSEIGIKERVTSFVISCLSETAISGVHLLAAGGGIIYPDLTKPILLSDYGMVNYASLNGVDEISRDKMENDLELFTIKTIPLCFLDFQQFEEKGIKIEVDYTSASAQYHLMENTLEVLLKVPMNIITPTGNVIGIKTVETKIPTSLLKITSAARSISGETISLSVPYTFTVFPFDEQTTVYSLTDENSPDHIPLTFLFAIRNDSLSLRQPELSFIPDKTFRVGQRWKDVLVATGQDAQQLAFQSDSLDFPVSPEGSIDLIISSPGTYAVTFTVQNKKGQSDQQQVTIHVLEQQDSSVPLEYNPEEIPEESINEN